MVLDFYLIINSTVSDGMYKRNSGNMKRDEELSVAQFKSDVEALLMSPAHFYVIGVGFIHIINGSGHQSTLDKIKEEWDLEIPLNRISIKMETGVILVPQYVQKRLAEGATQLPAGTNLVPKINFVNCEVSVRNENFIPFPFAPMKSVWEVCQEMRL